MVPTVANAERSDRDLSVVTSSSRVQGHLYGRCHKHPHPSFVGSRSPSPPPRVRILLGNVVTIALPPTGIVPACAASPLPAATAERAERVQNGREERTTLLLLSNAIADRAHNGQEQSQRRKGQEGVAKKL